MSVKNCDEKIYERFEEKYPDHYLNWSSIDKGKYIIQYATVPCFFLAKIKAKTKIPGVNSCLESSVYIFKTFDEIEEFFEELTGEKNES